MNRITEKLYIKALEEFIEILQDNELQVCGLGNVRYIREGKLMDPEGIIYLYKEQQKKIKK